MAQIKFSEEPFDGAIIFSSNNLTFCANHKKRNALRPSVSISLKKIGMDPLVVESKNLKTMLGAKAFGRPELTGQTQKMFSSAAVKQLWANLDISQLRSFEFNGLQLMVEAQYCDSEQAINLVNTLKALLVSMFVSAEPNRTLKEQRSPTM